MTTGTTADAASATFSAADAERFLYHEAELLDELRYDEWVGLLADDIRYLLPSTDVPLGDPTTDLFVICDDRTRLLGRVQRLQSRHAHADYPHPRTRRFITNVQVDPADGADLYEIRANFQVVSLRVGRIGTFIGQYRHLVRIAECGPRFVVRRANLDLESLDHAGGKVNIIV